MTKSGERLFNGLVKENPTFVLMLGMCPTLAVTTSAFNGLGMGLTTTAVLALSNLFISLLRKVIPNRVRIPAFIVIIATFVTVVQLLLQAYLPSLNDLLGVYIPLIVVNCIILGRAESYAYSNPPIPSLFDGIGMGLGFSFALTCIGAVRELLSAGKIFDYAVMPKSYEPIRIFGQAPGAFFVLAALVALQNFIKNKRKNAGKSYEKIGSGCSEDCMNCSEKGCSRRFYDASAKPKKEEAAEKTVKTDEKESTNQKDNANRKESVNPKENSNRKESVNPKENSNRKESVNPKENSNRKESVNPKENTTPKESSNRDKKVVQPADTKPVKNKNTKKEEEEDDFSMQPLDDDLEILDLDEEDES